MDFRYLFCTTAAESVPPQEEEVSGYAGRDADTIADDVLRARNNLSIRWFTGR